MKIIVTGASDDLIEIDGDLSEEFGASDQGDYLAFSDGTLLRIEYSRSGVWRITPAAQGSATVTITQAPEDDEANYTDRAEIDGDIRWIAQASHYETVRG